MRPGSGGDIRRQDAEVAVTYTGSKDFDKDFVGGWDRDRNDLSDGFPRVWMVTIRDHVLLAACLLHGMGHRREGEGSVYECA